MLLRSITFENFGLYAGIQKLDLAPTVDGKGRNRPVVLVGGKNGAGKTTMLEGIRLALYGRRALGSRVGEAEYHDYLRGRVHRGQVENSVPSDSARISLEFDYAEAGRVHRYRVTRSWSGHTKRLDERLTLEKDAEPLKAIPEEEWPHFLRELIPPGVSQLFFFDGEKISEIAAGEYDTELADAIRGMLGIELVGRLRTDLGLFLARRSRADDSRTATRLEEISRSKNEIAGQLSRLHEAVGTLRQNRASQAKIAEHARARFMEEGGDAASRRGQLEALRDELKRQIARRETELKDLANGLLPFAAAPKLVLAFKAALAGAAPNGCGNTASAQALRTAIAAWRNEDDPPRTSSWTPSHWADLEGFLDSWVVGTAEAPVLCPAFREVGDGASALARLEEAITTARPRAGLLTHELDRLLVQLGEVEADLVRADASGIGMLLDELTLAEKRLGATEADLRSREEELKLATFQAATLDREERRILDQQDEKLAAEHRLGLAARASQALGVYEQRLLDQKLAQLSQEFVSCFNQLARKDGFVSEIRLDRATFAATLVDREGREIPKADLSAGEKQVYAVAMLWALARTSGRALPIIIDTPLARLDSDHRINFVERYLPQASHQVVVLSTDTEIDDGLLRKLSPNVSHSYRLEYDPAEARTVVCSGYFAEGGQRALQQA